MQASHLFGVKDLPRYTFQVISKTIGDTPRSMLRSQ